MDYSDLSLTLLKSKQMGISNWSFDIVEVFRHDDSGELFWVADSGCSCPVPFDWVKSLEDFSTGSWQDFKEFLEHGWPDPLDGDYHSNGAHRFPMDRHELLEAAQ